MINLLAEPGFELAQGFDRNRQMERSPFGDSYEASDVGPQGGNSAPRAIGVFEVHTRSLIGRHRRSNLEREAFVDDLERFHRNVVAGCLERRPFDLVDPSAFDMPPQHLFASLVL